MLAKLGEPSIDPRDPWGGDVFDRKSFGVTLSQMIEAVTQPFVISVKGEWGSGKSIFLRRLRLHLEERPSAIPVVHVDAWKSDHYEDPIYALIAALEDRLERHRAVEASRAENVARISRDLFASATKVIAPLMKIVGAAVDLGTGGAAGGLISGAGDLGGALVQANDQKTKAQDKFLRTLTEARDELLGRNTDTVPRPFDNKIVIMIDELDRCRPDYAIKLLERIKHFFEITGIVFVIAVDGKNLHHAVNTLYGPAVESEVYLRKFFDLEMYLPKPSTQSFNAVLRQSFNVGAGTDFETAVWGQLKQRIFGMGFRDGHSAKLAMLEASAYFEVIAEAYGLKLRDQAQAFARLNACVLANNGNRFFLPFAAAFLVCLRYYRHDLYEDWRVSSLAPRVIQSLQEADLHQPILDVDAEAGRVIRIYLTLCQSRTTTQIAKYINRKSGEDAAAYIVVLHRMPNDMQKLIDSIELSYENVFAVAGMLEKE